MGKCASSTGFTEFPLFKKVLIANRGEIAVRIADVCRGMSLQSVAVYSDPDRDAPHVASADEAVPLGGSRAIESYVDIAKVIEAARRTHADAIHPGYGFLSEDASFAEACEAAGLTFVGPRPHTLRVMADKSSARRKAVEAKVPVLPGSDGLVSYHSAFNVARSIGFPVLCKRTGGGGGLGLTVARDDESLRAVLQGNWSRDRSLAGDVPILLERYLERPRHVEVQVLSDSHGRHLHLFERECSIQRRHQKMVEECPSPLASSAGGARLLSRLYEAALRLSSSIDYVGAGTIEFLVERDDYYFIEMNPRLQVEHPCTELTTGIDIIGWQLRIASGEPLPFGQDEIRRSGHVIELRICAEDPARSFFPSPGNLLRFEPPLGDGIRVDAGVRAGTVITPFYDSMIAKLIVAGVDRVQAVERARAALDAFKIEGIKTNIPAHREILRSEAFSRGELSTRFIEENTPYRERSATNP